MTAVDRYLHFDNIDVEQPYISSRCSYCGQTFEAEPSPLETPSSFEKDFFQAADVLTAVCPCWIASLALQKSRREFDQFL
jgi:hypothetical protein